MDWLLKPFGLTQDQQAETYAGQLKDDRTGTKDWNAGDMLRDVLTPGTREELEAKAKKFKEDKINKLTKPRQGLIGESLSGTQIDTQGLDIRDLETEVEHEARLKGLELRGNANVQNLGIEDYDPSKVTAGMGTSEILRLGTTQKTTNRGKEEGKVQTEVRYQERRGDKIRADAYTDAAKIRADDRAAQREDNRLTRDLSMLSGDREMAIAQMNADLADKRMSYDRETRRMDKRSAAIAQLMSGLGSLGGAFTL